MSKTSFFWLSKRIIIDKSRTTTNRFNAFARSRCKITMNLLSIIKKVYNPEEIKYDYMKTYFLISIIFSTFILRTVGFAQIKPARIFSDNMVLQRGTEIPVWGKATPGEIITVELGEEIVTGKTDVSGKWKVFLSKIKAGGPLNLKISGESDCIVFKNVLIGDVWLASGQSNMEHPIIGWEWIPHSEVLDFEKEISASNIPEIRLFTVQKFLSPVALDDLNGGYWEEASPKTISNFSSTAWFFAKEIYQQVKVPIGIINCSWGGTSIKTWLSESSLDKLQEVITPSDRVKYDSVKWIEEIRESLQKNRVFRNAISYPPVGFAEKISKLFYNDSEWETVSDIQDINHKIGAITWLRKEFNITLPPMNGTIDFSFGHLDRQSNIFINGHEIGYFQYPSKVIKKIPANLLQKGKNTIVVRLAQPWGKGKIIGDSSNFYVKNPDNSTNINLAEGWKMNNQIEFVPEIGRGYHNYPSFLFNGMISPIIPFAIKGFIWYQGESDSGIPLLYEKMFYELILDWRSRWKLGNLPFLYVQITNTLDSHDASRNSSKRPPLREVQRRTLSVPETGMVVSYDMGDLYDVHPKNKQDFGKRLALQALKVAYKQCVAADGPVYRTFGFKEKSVIIDFGEEILIDNKKGFHGFEISGSDGLYYPADIKIKGSTVSVSSLNVQNPVTVRYNWLDNPENFIRNKDGLPAGPFIIEKY